MVPGTARVCSYIYQLMMMLFARNCITAIILQYYTYSRLLCSRYVAFQHLNATKICSTCFQVCAVYSTCTERHSSTLVYILSQIMFFVDVRKWREHNERYVARRRRRLYRGQITGCLKKDNPQQGRDSPREHDNSAAM